MSYTIIQYRAKCIGCNACVEAAPSRWRISRKDGKCSLVGAESKNGIFTTKIQDQEYDENRRAADNYPVHIIQIHQTSK